MATTIDGSKSTSLNATALPISHTVDSDNQKPAIVAEPLHGKPDIEHAIVEDDPRKWGPARKNAILAIVSGASMIAGLAANIQNPANAQIEQDLHTTSGNISWSLSLFILVQGNFPIIWSAISEIKGRMLVYVLSISLFTIGSIVVATSNTIGLLIGMRILQAAGSSAVMAIAAATLADIYESHERGTKMGIYYSAPLLGPSLGPILGGALTQGFNWRAVFWFLVVWGFIILMAFLFLFKDTFRRERSLTYQHVLRMRMRERAHEHSKRSTVTDRGHSTELDHAVPQDLEAQTKKSGGTPAPPALTEVKLSLKDVNPFPPLWKILKRKNNISILIPSGLIFAFSYSMSYTCARTLADSYGYDALKTGLVLLSLGVGDIVGSQLGGRWSDRTLAKLKAQNGGRSYPEMRLESTKLAMPFLPLSVIAYAWICEKHVNVAAICVTLFLAGFFSIWIYTSTLAYIVDANKGRSSTAVAANSAFRGGSAFVAAEVAIPLQNAIGDGGLYTLWGGLLIITELLILVVIYKGEKWREEGEAEDEDKPGK
ncbi:hypothetical protein SERLA73DRAFT_55283 [Serpula lacrymans var. lacrymans S7.3]|uniref:Major facilitator superfamily (MFS) profile domain-containing protein n=1 Tax=Serpula lacrymans var. lacrymans (strain S7.3) TaxID=936435 RepID=F8Q1G4_SERL3|nr:hypothetical protein SERLA73DRAFT_55283 [Serpula lacrymans var. lacrymans S7.3]